MDNIVNDLIAKIKRLEIRLQRQEAQEKANVAVWDDLVMPLVSTMRGATAKPDYDYTNMGMLFPRNDASEILYITVQMPHCWAQGTRIYPHLHFRRTSSAIPKFYISYSWTNIGDTIAAFSAATLLDTFTPAYSAGSIHQIAYLDGGIKGTNKTISSILNIKLYRNDNAVTGDVLAYQFDIHYLKDSNGSRQEYVK